MVAYREKVQLLARDEVVAPPAGEVWQDYGFEIPTALYAATAALFLGFVAILSLAFANPGMAVPFAICVAFIAAFFAVPTIFVRAAPKGSARSLSWARFMEHGIATPYGRCGGGEAAVLVLVLPALIFCWSLAIAAIAALA